MTGACLLLLAARLVYPGDAFSLSTTPVGSRWPGRHVDAAKGAVDFSTVRELSFVLSNRLDRPLPVQLSVKSKARQGRSPGGDASLKPKGVGILRCDLHPEPWRIDAPLKLEGMYGRPPCEGDASSLYDVRAVTSMHLFLSSGEKADSFDVLSVAASDEAVKPAVVFPAKTFLPFVDRYGQFAHADWPGKVHSDDELVRARADEEAWLAENGGGPVSDVDAWGGWTKGPQLKATGFFRTEKVDGKWWLVDPDGRLFWSHGVDCVSVGGEVTGVSFREDYFAWLPPADDPAFGAFYGKGRHAVRGLYAETNRQPYVTYSFAAANHLRKYGPDWRAHAIDLAHRRLKAWGLNTVANWSSSDVCRARRTPYTLCLGTYGTPRRAGSHGWWGPLPDPENPEFEKTLRERARKAAKTMKGDPWCLGVFIDNEMSWNDLPDLEHVAEAYYATVARVVHEELPNHLYFGSRIAWATPEVYRVASRHCDVVSVNVYSRVFDRELPAGAADKPLINGEFHFGALDRGMFHTGLVATRDQRDRAAHYRAYVDSCLDDPRVVGTHWFQWRDQPLTGRPSDGENFQIGFLTCTDDPYPELVEAARDVARGMYARRFGSSALVSDDLECR